MIGTKEGLWFSMQQHGDGIIDYEFFCHNALLERGIREEDEMFRRFDALERSYKAPQ